MESKRRGVGAGFIFDRGALAALHMLRGSRCMQACVSRARSAPGTATRFLLPNIPLPGWICSAGCWGVPCQPLRSPLRGSLVGRCPCSPSVAWKTAHPPGAGGRTVALAPGAARCCRLLWVQLNNKCIYWDFCYHEGVNNPLPDPSHGLSSRPVPAPTAAATLTRLGKSLMKSPGGGSAAGLDPVQAGACCPSPHQSQPMAGWSHPALP